MILYKEYLRPVRNDPAGLRAPGGRASIGRMRRRLTREEREIRQGSGIPFTRWWPIPAIFLALGWAAFDSMLFVRCLGDPLQYGGRGGAVIRMLVAIPCSPLLLRGPSSGWLLFAAIWVSVLFAVRNYRWAKRQRAYWNGVRAREQERRAAKAEARRNSLDGENGPPADPAD